MGPGAEKKTTVMEKINLITFCFLKREIKDEKFKSMNTGVNWEIPVGKEAD